jgi:hypothetical protein
VYGFVTPVFPPEIGTLFDLAHVFAGGSVVYTSDQHFGVGSNLILPGRGVTRVLVISLYADLGLSLQEKIWGTDGRQGAADSKATKIG